MMVKADGPVLGKLIGQDEHPGRDCIHVAIAPVVAGEYLIPGQKVGLVDGRARVGLPPGIHAIGVVDPFLGNAVNEGEKFYLFLFPNSVTSMRHVWTHDAFKPRVTSLNDFGQERRE